MSFALNDTGTEEKIKEAARILFLEKGFDGTKMRDIAQTAGINCALTNYYFRSKDNLFRIVFNEMLKESIKQFDQLLNSPTSLKEKVTELINKQFQFNMKNPSLALFIMNEIRKEPKSLLQQTGLKEIVQASLFSQQVDDLVAQKQLRPVSAIELLGAMHVGVHQLFAGKALTMFLFNMDEAAFQKYAEEQIKHTISMIHCYFFGEERPVEVA